MKISEFKNQLLQVNQLNFLLPNGATVPAHFHITEAGLSTKHFVDCGGKLRDEHNIVFQVWVAGDTDHRLSPLKLLRIIEISDRVIGDADHEVEIEYQSDTIGRYALEFHGGNFLLAPKFTACLAADNCGIEPETVTADKTEKVACCGPASATGSSCCN